MREPLKKPFVAVYIDGRLQNKSRNTLDQMRFPHGRKIGIKTKKVKNKGIHLLETFE